VPVSEQLGDVVEMVDVRGFTKEQVWHLETVPSNTQRIRPTSDLRSVTAPPGPRPELKPQFCLYFQYISLEDHRNTGNTPFFSVISSPDKKAMKVQMVHVLATTVIVSSCHGRWSEVCVHASPVPPRTAYPHQVTEM
jgi:hypothetical protein